MELFKSTYRLDPEGHAELYRHVESLSEKT